MTRSHKNTLPSIKRGSPPKSGKSQAKRGPKGKFEDSMISEVFKLARFGLTNKEIADFYEVNISSIEKYSRDIPAFKQALQKGRLLDSLKAVASLHKQVQGYDVEEIELREAIDKWGNIHTLRKVTKKHIGPNITATIYLLKTRHGDKWMDIFKVDNNYTINHQLDLSNLSNEELLSLEQLGIKLTTDRLGKKQLMENAESN